MYFLYMHNDLYIYIHACIYMCICVCLQYSVGSLKVIGLPHPRGLDKRDVDAVHTSSFIVAFGSVLYS